MSYSQRRFDPVTSWFYLRWAIFLAPIVMGLIAAMVLLAVGLANAVFGPSSTILVIFLGPPAILLVGIVIGVRRMFRRPVNHQIRQPLGWQAHDGREKIQTFS